MTPVIDYVSKGLKYVATYLAIAGLVTFSLFILEESFQTVMFGTWPAQDARQWEIVNDGCELMDNIVWTMKVVNYTVGYVQPIAFVSYRKYAQSAEYYVKALKAKIFAYRPDLFLNEKISFDFTVREIRKQSDGSFLLLNGKTGVICHENQKRRNLSVSGVLKQSEDGGFYYVDIRK